jgi:O-antigen ligase/polysaccharide polymerase Wzy-like membrane protein
VDNQATSSLRASLIAPLLAGCAFVVACHYYDPGLNLAFLLYALVFVWVAGLAAGGRRIAQAVLREPYLSAGCAAAIAALVVHHLIFSVSRDSSFPPSLVLATLPVMALLTTSLDGRLLFRLIGLFVACMAVYTAGAYLIWEERAYGTLLDPNNFATLLYLVWIPLLHSQLDPAAQRLSLSGFTFSPAQRLLVLSVVNFIFVLALLATHSRYAWLVLTGAVVYWGLLSLYQKIHWPTFGAVLVTMALAGLIYAGLGSDELQANVASSAVTAQVQDESVRLQLLQSTWQMIREVSGFAGAGIYTFSLFYPQYRSVFEQNTPGLYAHNDFLQLFFEGGVLVAIPLLVLVVAVVVGFLRRSFARGAWDSKLGLFLALGFALLHANVNFVFYVLPIAMLLGVLVGLAFRSDPGRPAAVSDSLVVAETNGVRSLTWLVRSTMAGALICLLLLLLDVFNYGVFSGQKGMPGVAHYREDAGRMLKFAQLSQQINPHRGIPKLAHAVLLERRLGMQPDSQRLKEVTLAYQGAIAADPWNPQALINFVHFSLKYGTGEDLQPLVLQAFALNPQGVDAAVLAIDYLVATENLSKAQGVAVEAGRWCEDIARRSATDLDRLGVRMSELYAQAPSPALAETLKRCRASRQTIQSKQSARSWLMHWLTAE